ncbi:hypothetical protein ACJX0J_038319, partial [Zea mays]
SVQMVKPRTFWRIADGPPPRAGQSARPRLLKSRTSSTGCVFCDGEPRTEQVVRGVWLGRLLAAGRPNSARFASTECLVYLVLMNAWFPCGRSRRPPRTSPGIRSFVDSVRADIADMCIWPKGKGDERGGKRYRSYNYRFNLSLKIHSYIRPQFSDLYIYIYRFGEILLKKYKLAIGSLHFCIVVQVTATCKLYIVPISRPSSDGGLKRKRDAFNDDANPQKFIPYGASTSRFYGENIQQLCPGCHVEVLSQDSGIRGCWFRCLILKRHKDKIKVCYLELQDADETENLEEWVMLTRVAKPDQLGVRFLGRPMVRPQRVEQSKASCFDVGAIVDAWWHGGWWEGIVLCQVGSGRLQVYFPGENRTTEFGEDELRCSLEWVGNKWNPLKGRKDVTSKLTSTADCGSECLIGKQDPLNFYTSIRQGGTISRDQKRKAVGHKHGSFGQHNLVLNLVIFLLSGFVCREGRKGSVWFWF